MALRQPIKPGISGASVTNIPEKWSAQWFRGFITTHLQNSDARNQIAGTGITLTPPAGGNVGAPGTVSVSNQVQALFNEPYLLAVAPSDTVLNDYRVIAGESGIITTNDGGPQGALTISFRQSAGTSVVGNPTNALANITDITAAADGTVLQRAGGALSFAAVPLAAIVPIGAATVLGNVTGSPAVPAALSQTQLTSLVNLATASLSGAMPVLSGNAAQFLNGAGAFATPAYPASANPSATIGLTAVDGSAATFLTSDSAPALSQAIAPTWTNPHIFTPGAGTAISATAPSAAVPVFNFVGLDNSNIGFFRAGGTNGGNVVFYDTGASVARGYIGFGPGGILPGGAITDFGLSAGTGGTVRITRAGESANAFAVGPNGNVTIAAPSSGVALAVTGTATISSGLGVNGASAPAQVTGWGTPAGPAVVGTFPATPTLAQCGAAIGEIIVALKAVGIFGA